MPAVWVTLRHPKAATSWKVGDTCRAPLPTSAGDGLQYGVRVAERCPGLGTYSSIAIRPGYEPRKTFQAKNAQIPLRTPVRPSHIATPFIPSCPKRPAAMSFMGTAIIKTVRTWLRGPVMATTICSIPRDSDDILAY